MAELLFWNTLSESANWLGETLGEQVTPKSLIQKILDRAVLVTKPLTGAPLPPTVIKALLPRGVRIASVWLFPKQSDVGEFEKRMNERMVQVHGVPVTGGIYTGHVQKQVIPLLPFQIADLITHGNIEIGLVHENQLDGYKFRESECGFILPVGTPHIATLETCGINRDDLLVLANQLGASGIAQADDAQILTDVRFWATTDSLVEAFEPYGLTEEKIRNGSTKYIEDAKKLQGQGGKGRAVQPMFCPYEIMQGLVHKAKPKLLKECRGWEILEKRFSTTYTKFQKQDPRQFTD